MNVENFLTVRELIERLKVLDQDAVVALSSDSEGNNYTYMGKHEYPDECLTQNDMWSAEILSDEDGEETLTTKNFPNWKEEGYLNTVIFYPS